MFELGIHNDISNTDYHAIVGDDEMYYSSSQLKALVDDPEVFYKKYISKELPSSSSMPAFDVGSYFHTAILEPHLLEKEFAVYTGKVRRGKDWEAFQSSNLGKTILTLSMAEQAKNLISAVKDSPIADALLQGGEAEQSLFVNLDGTRIKVRFDYLVLGKDASYIADLKSTSGNVKNVHTIQSKICSLQYELSAALYMRAANQYIKEAGLDVAPVTGFYLIFASKDQMGCKTYMLSKDQIAIGNRKIDVALKALKHYQGNGWEFEDRIDIIYPPQYEIDTWLKEKKEEKIPEVKVNLTHLV